MAKIPWEESFGAGITICDREGVILAMNGRAAEAFASDGGRALVGKSLYPCHNPDSQEKIRSLILRQERNVYTVEKKGQKKLILQAPWFADSACQGLVELSIELPAEMPHFVRS